jgi:hypothetical protein
MPLMPDPVMPDPARYRADGRVATREGGREAAVFAAVRAAWGATLLCWPGPVLRVAAGHPGSTADRFVLRLLGARHLCQAAVTATRPTPAVLGTGSVVDLLHAASQVMLACGGPRWRRAAALDAFGAAAFAAAGFTAAQSRRRPAGR